MGINPSTKKELIELAQSQMALRGEIDALIFITHDVSAGLRETRENLDKVTADFNRALESMQEKRGPENTNDDRA